MAGKVSEGRPSAVVGGRRNAAAPSRSTLPQTCPSEPPQSRLRKSVSHLHGWDKCLKIRSALIQVDPPARPSTPCGRCHLVDSLAVYRGLSAPKPLWSGSRPARCEGLLLRPIILAGRRHGRAAHRSGDPAPAPPSRAAELPAAFSGLALGVCRATAARPDRASARRAGKPRNGKAPRPRVFAPAPPAASGSAVRGLPRRYPSGEGRGAAGGLRSPNERRSGWGQPGPPRRGAGRAVTT